MPQLYHTSGLKEFIFGFDEQTNAQYPFLFEDHNIDRDTCSRQVPVRLLSLGMGRMGTASMKVALTQLGYPTLHGFDKHSNPKDCDMWMDAINTKFFKTKTIDLNRPFWDKLLGHVSAVTDFPADMFGPELIAAYPEAKVILVERDIDKWFASYEQAIIANTDIPWLYHATGYIDDKYAKMTPVLWHGAMRGQFRAKTSMQWRQNAKQVYREHYDGVRRLMKEQPERLLELDLSEGWEPLCEFLGEDVPEGDFPKVNEQKQHDRIIAIVTTMLGRRLLVKLLKMCAPVAAGVLMWLYRRDFAS